tara:strand:+ start:102 stop:863 length:762 start_codon:yes stop_codon:yes gene_type:complete
MKRFRRVIKDLNFTLTEIAIFENIVNATIIFLGFYLILSLLNIPFYFSVVPALVYLVVYSLMSLNSSKALIVESKHEPLKEKLRTAADNIERDSPIIDELEYEVTSEMKKVGMSMFINPKTLSYKIFVATLLSFMIMFSSTINIDFDKFKFNQLPIIFENKMGSGDFVAQELDTSEDIYGDDNVAQLGDNELSIKIKPVDFKVSVKEEGTFEGREFETIYPKDIVVTETDAFDENIAQEDQELVKNYFKKLAS